MKRRARTFLIGTAATCLAAACNAETGHDGFSSEPDTYRFATFNIAMGLPEAGAMATALQSGADPRLQALAIVLQTVRPDVVLLSEFDYDPQVDAAGFLNRNYLERASDGREPIFYPHSLQPEVNTGVDSGLDLDGDGASGEPEDAWGFGRFPGQYGMLILSKYPIQQAGVRSFRHFRWSRLPEALRPYDDDGGPHYPDTVWQALRLSSKNHLDLPIQFGSRVVHVLASHPTPPVFDGPEDRNGRRNHDELAFWSHYISQPDASWLVDDQGRAGGLPPASDFVVMGDLNADPADGASYPGAIARLLDHPAIDSSCIPKSAGGAEAAIEQAGINREHRGDPAADTSDFNDETVGNYRIDYVLPSRNLKPLDCGVFWPEAASPIRAAATFSDHRLVWVDLEL